MSGEARLGLASERVESARTALSNVLWVRGEEESARASFEGHDLDARRALG